MDEAETRELNSLINNGLAGRPQFTLVLSCFRHVFRFLSTATSSSLYPFSLQDPSPLVALLVYSN
jgi:hypothetical protein